MFARDEPARPAPLSWIGPAEDRTTVAASPVGDGVDTAATINDAGCGVHARIYAIIAGDGQCDLRMSLRSSQWRRHRSPSDLRRMEIETLRAELEKPGRSQAALARAMGFPDNSYVNKILAGTRLIKAAELPLIEAYLKKTAKVADGEESAAEPPEQHIGNTPDFPSGFGMLEHTELVDIPEYDVRLSAGGGQLIDAENIIDTWRLSRRYLEGELRLNPSHLAVVQVEGDSMEPTLRSGDRVLVDHSDRNPAKPGIYAIWDSNATVVKRLEKVPASDPPTVVLISDNKNHHEYRVPAELVNIIGRVVWFARRL